MDNNTYISIVNKLVELRKKHHIKTTDMAAYTDVSRQSIYNFESLRFKSYQLILSYITHPAFSLEELEPVYKILGG